MTTISATPPPHTTPQATTEAKMKATAKARREADTQLHARKVGRQEGRVPPIFDEPHKALLLESEAIEWLRLDALHGGDLKKAAHALHRLVYAKKLIRPICYSGKGGGHRIYPLAELQAFVEKMRGAE